jgi:hypothetical protein
MSELLPSEAVETKPLENDVSPTYTLWQMVSYALGLGT